MTPSHDLAMQVVLDLPNHLASQGSQQQGPTQQELEDDVDLLAGDLSASAACSASGTRASDVGFTSNERRGRVAQGNKADRQASDKKEGALEQNGVTQRCNAHVTLPGDVSTLAYR